MQAFERLVKLYFEHKVGRSFVDRGDYDLTTTDGDSVSTPIHSGRWKSIVKPGRSLYMNAILRQTKGIGPRKCPSCQNSVDSQVDTKLDISIEW